MSQMLCSYIEYEIDHEYINFSMFGRVWLEQYDYTFFALLGGGPCQDKIEPVFALRGMPTNSNLLTHLAFHLVVTDRETDKDRWVSRREADRWVAQGDALWVNENHITDPDYFGPSWLTTEEFALVYGEYKKNNLPGLVCAEAAISAMRLLPEARLVYWFGN